MKAKQVGAAGGIGAIVLAVAAVLSGQPPTYIDPDGWFYYEVDGQTPDGWHDPACSTGDYAFKVVLFKDAGFSGPRVMLCHAATSLCDIHMDEWPRSLMCSSVTAGNNTAADAISSIRTTFVRASGGCVKVWGDSSFSGPVLKLVQGQAVNNMGSTAVGNDAASSIKRAFAANC